ncbi:MAG: hypothetical protein PUJ19_01145 [Campylobacteraceae bacterium]|nr:hypothetical protein [Campylobacteraceae bacterium]
MPKRQASKKNFFIFYLFCRIFGEFIIKNFKAILEFLSVFLGNSRTFKFLCLAAAPKAISFVVFSSVALFSVPKSAKKTS